MSRTLINQKSEWKFNSLGYYRIRYFGFNKLNKLKKIAINKYSAK